MVNHDFADYYSEHPALSSRGGLSTRKLVMGISAIVVIGLTYGVYALLSTSDDSQSSNGDQSADTTQDARTTTGTIALYAPARPATQTATANPAASARPGNQAKAAAPMIPVTPIEPAASPVPAAAPQFRDAAQAMQAARLAFRANDLSTAQAAIGAAQTLQPGNADAQAMAGELRPLSARRDTALQAAQACVAQQSWPCARQHANEALNLDAGSETAKTILERVIRETGWAPLNSHGAAGSSPAPAKSQPQTQLQTQTARASPQLQLQTPPPQGMPTRNATMPAASHAVPNAGAPGSIEARERAIKDSGWTRSTSNGARPSASAPPGQ